MTGTRRWMRNGSQILMLLMLAGFAWMARGDEGSGAHLTPGGLTFSLGFTLMLAYVLAQSLQRLRLPLISGYILAGVLAGPYVSDLLSTQMVRQLRLVDELALGMIALTAGGSLKLALFRDTGRAICVTVLTQTAVIFLFVFVFVFFSWHVFEFTLDFTPGKVMVLACLLGVISVARSPSSAIAIIDECRARGPFTDHVLGVTVIVDVLIIILFTLALTFSKLLLFSGPPSPHHLPLLLLFLEIGSALILGFLLGKAVSFYMLRVGHDLPLFMLFFTFSVSRLALLLNGCVQSEFGLEFQMEPLLLCMSAGFTVQNFSRTGPLMMETLERISLPIYAVFFSLAGASIDLEALRLTWPLAFCLAATRAFGMFSATWLAGTLNRHPPVHRNVAWMAYLTQAGVSIGLAQLAERHFPAMGVYLTTVVLAVIAINQFIGPITFKSALHRVGEAERG